MVSQKCLRKVYHSLLHSDLLQQTHNRADVVCIACMSITFSTPFGYTLDFVCSLLFYSSQSKPTFRMDIRKGCFTTTAESTFFGCISLWPCGLKPIHTVLPCSTHPSFRSFAKSRGCQNEERNRSIKAPPVQRTKHFEIIYKARIFFLTPSHSRPFHPVPDGRPFGVAGVSGFLKNGVWLDWRGETWRYMEYEVMRWDEDTELVYGTRAKHWYFNDSERKESTEAWNSRRICICKCSCGQLSMANLGNKTMTLKLLPDSLKAGQRQLEPKKLCHLIHLSAPWRLFLYWKTHVQLSCVVDPVFGSWHSLESLQQGRVAVWYMF